MNKVKERILDMREKEKNIEYMLYLARDDFEYDEYDETYSLPGKLHLFYDKPTLEYDQIDRKYKFGQARLISEIPSYMFPNIYEKTYIVYKPIKNNGEYF